MNGRTVHARDSRGSSKWWVRLGGLSLLVAMAVSAQTNAGNIVTVVKIVGIGWFNRMEQGVVAFAKAPEAQGRTTRQTGPTKADAIEQIKVIDELLAGPVQALAVVPFDPPTLELTLKKAIDKGVKVVTHEADTQRFTHADVEAFSNGAYGARLNERMARCMNGSGRWTVFVGSIGSQTHMQWAEGGIENARKRHPQLQLVDPKQESTNSVEQAYVKAKEILLKYPDITGFQGSSSVDVLGIARAVQEAGLQDKTCVYGTGLPSEAAKWLKTGAIDGVSLWDPKDAGLVMNRIAVLLLDNKPLADGMDLGVPGYRKVSVRKGPGIGVIVTGEAWIDIDRGNVDLYPF